MIRIASIAVAAITALAGTTSLSEAQSRRSPRDAVGPAARAPRDPDAARPPAIRWNTPNAAGNLGGPGTGGGQGGP